MIQRKNFPFKWNKSRWYTWMYSLKIMYDALDFMLLIFMVVFIQHPTKKKGQKEPLYSFHRNRRLNKTEVSAADIVMCKIKDAKRFKSRGDIELGQLGTIWIQLGQNSTQAQDHNECPWSKPKPTWKTCEQLDNIFLDGQTSNIVALFLLFIYGKLVRRQLYS